MESYTWDDTTQLKTEEIVLRATLAQRPSRAPALPTSPPPSRTIISREDPDEGHPSTSNSENESDSNSSDQSITFFRKSSSPSRICHNKRDHFAELPWHIMKNIFSRLDILERANASEVCRRWHHILTGGLCPLENVVVLNIFQKKVWQNSVSKNTGSA